MKGSKYGMLTILRDMGEKDKNGFVIYLCKCDCGAQKKVSWKLLKNEKKPRSCGCSKKLNGKKRFESLYEKTENCWIWIGKLTANGYGKFRSVAASRASYKYYIGDIPKGLQVCHTCDNRKCVNPSHLFLGTLQDNLKDMTDKGRRARGSKIASSTLTEEQVLEMRKMRLSGCEYQEIAGKFGADWYTVRNVCKNNTWQHVALGQESKTVKQVRKPAKGSRTGSAKLKESDVLEIKALLKDGIQGREIARMFGVNFSTISDIKRSRTWTHI